MKKILVTALLSVLCFGCVTETWNDNHYKTLYAHDYMYNPLKSSLCETDFYMRMCVHVDNWVNSTDNTQREQLEDLYMNRYKLRHHGDTVKIISNTLDCTVITAGKRLNEAGAEWLVVRNDDMLAVQRLGDNRWHLTSVTDKFVGLRPMFDIELLSQDRISFVFSIKGSCEWYSSVGVGMRMPDIEYKIDDKEPICFNVPLSLDDYEKQSPYQGVVEVEEIETENLFPAQMKFYEGNRYDITYRGHTEQWPLFYYE